MVAAAGKLTSIDPETASSWKCQTLSPLGKKPSTFSPGLTAGGTDASGSGTDQSRSCQPQMRFAWSGSASATILSQYTVFGCGPPAALMFSKNGFESSALY